MDATRVERQLMRAGFILFTLTLLTGFAIPAFLNHRMAAEAHLTGILNALLLIVLGLSWGRMTMGPLQARWTRSLFLFATFANWGTACLAAAWGTSRMTPLSGAGFAAAAWQEGVVQALQVLLALAIVAGAVSVVVALRSPRS